MIYKKILLVFIILLHLYNNILNVFTNRVDSVTYQQIGVSRSNTTLYYERPVLKIIYYSSNFSNDKFRF